MVTLALVSTMKSNIYFINLLLYTLIKQFRSRSRFGSKKSQLAQIILDYLTI